MLILDKITKTYQSGEIKVEALKGVDINFRKNEFVSILGPSGCGKTTLLNIIGGLDRYTSGDLNIKGTSTKSFHSRDWDTYRNHSVGFVFQSYNLIPHQTVLGNVSLALTIAGVSKSERITRAKIALDKVGLSDQYYKKPNQMSGGQMQRVAIARALVNEPEILLADEPTGALDTVTSKQIMDLLKELAKERLIIMVTHNPELAEEYSTRIIKLLDGNLMSDSNPYTPPAVKAAKKVKPVEVETTADIAPVEAVSDEPVRVRGKRYAKMSVFTAFKLSLQNLISKRRRSIMTSFAGSIGIIGVALVLAFSFGVQGFITNMQRDMLSGNPITIERTAFDLNSMMSGMNAAERNSVLAGAGYVNVDSMVEIMAKRASGVQDMFVSNDITANYVRFLEEMPSNYLAALFLDYGLDMSHTIFTEYRDHDDEALRNPRTLSLASIRSIFGSILGETGLAEYSSLISTVQQPFQQLPADADAYIRTQYNLVNHGSFQSRIASAPDEINIVLGPDGFLTDLMLAQLGFYSQQEFMNIVYAVSDRPADKNMIDPSAPTNRDRISYEELLDLNPDGSLTSRFTWYENNDVFIANALQYNTTLNPDNIPLMPTYLHDAEDVLSRNQDAGMPLKIVGILEPKSNLAFGMLDNGFYYTTALAEMAIEANRGSYMVRFAKLMEDNNQQAGGVIQQVARGAPGPTTSPIPMTVANPLYPDTPGSQPTIEVDWHVMGMSYQYEFTFVTAISVDTDGKVTRTTQNRTGNIGLVGSGSPFGAMMGLFAGMFGGGGNASGIVTVSSATISTQQLGASDLPYAIGIYPASLEIKGAVLKYLDRWNDEDVEITLWAGTANEVTLTYEDRDDIMYMDPLSLIFRMISDLVYLITIALVSFTSLALVVSSVMVGIITYISVVERIREIGVIRSLGGRKRDVANLFIAETGILGFVSGMFGVIVTYVAAFLVSILVMHLADIPRIAFLPLPVAGIMILLSMSLTLISGLMPARSAAKKDPAVALRTE
jgi:putative ABC transport system permease protein